ncbi:hypothetical protein EMIHUDRAFT_235154 [Emiliania huxleyi CCMP1516]|uniref:Inosine/uridine-preferring nucleoside hydrolase domain-containing protein n=2 Tax=Emiliania huxleyi TaxID=2903 RepID=A0A0D3JX52_EMIH1|nr:hypothetical protein EMIHUDRAFT_235154 [Emiliania huxleyi CCMP1516]EOD28087.1 hypothetical protein EMIHUDRAFT_235154 [Emiliania huxleyi CCMP1516]|eukprot:XP_005780516.1 hypothetical protein EMIHUDRAFT_235154 [Emiliania huxleyi CCMP1516]
MTALQISSIIAARVAGAGRSCGCVALCTSPLKSRRARAVTDPVGDPLYVLCLGAPTNVANALLIAPEIAANIVVVWDASSSLTDGRVVLGGLNLNSDLVATRGEGPVSDALWERYATNPDYFSFGTSKWNQPGTTRMMWDTFLRDPAVRAGADVWGTYPGDPAGHLGEYTCEQLSEDGRTCDDALFLTAGERVPTHAPTPGAGGRADAGAWALGETGAGRSVVEMTYQGGLASRSNPNRDLLVKLNLAGLGFLRVSSTNQSGAVSPARGGLPPEVGAEKLLSALDLLLNGGHVGRAGDNIRRVGDLI